MDISAGGGVSRGSREENIGFIYVVSGTATRFNFVQPQDLTRILRGYAPNMASCRL